LKIKEGIKVLTSSLLKIKGGDKSTKLHPFEDKGRE